MISFLKKKNKIIVLFFLYLSQGLPFGFQVTALPVYLRTENVSLTAIGLIGLLAAPWMFKALWAPLVDRFGNRKFGHRKSWIVPLQILLFLVILFASFLNISKNLYTLLITIFFMNLFAATQDIAVDGLAIDILKENDLGYGNAVQVVGFKTGMLLSGGLLIWLSSYVGWSGFFYIMAGISIFPIILLLFFKEEDSRDAQSSDDLNFKEIINSVIHVFKLPGHIWFIIFIATYKLGEVMIDVMFKPFLVDMGISASQIGLWVGTFGMAASIAGSFFGGFLSSKYGIFRALAFAAVLRCIPLVMELSLTVIPLENYLIIITTISEHFFGGMVTTAMFAFMMSRVDKKIGATHYTILASIEVLGKSPGAWLSGIIADRAGYTVLFGIGVFISLLTLLILFKVSDDRKISL